LTEGDESEVVNGNDDLNGETFIERCVGLSQESSAKKLRKHISHGAKEVWQILHDVESLFSGQNNIAANVW
jgi:hypothetical protein